MMAANNAGWGGYGGATGGGGFGGYGGYGASSAAGGGFGGYPAQQQSNYGAQQQSNYGAQAAAGGFMNSPMAGNMYSQGADTPKTGGAGGRRATAIQPILIHQLHAATEPIPDNGLRFEDMELSMVLIIARVTRINELSTKVSYLLEDGTGSIDASVYLGGTADNEHLAARRAEIAVGTYVRCIGNVRVQQNNRFISVFNIKPIKDPNEITYHFLESVHSYLFSKHGPPSTSGVQQMVPVKMDPMQSAAFSNSAYAPQQQTSLAPGVNELNPLQRKVYELFYQHRDRPDGLNISQVCDALRGWASETDIRASIDWMNNEGMVYNTIDDETFKVIE